MSLKNVIYKNILIGSGIFLLSACETTPNLPIIIREPVNISNPPIVMPRPQSPEFENVDYVVLTKENINEVFDNLSGNEDFLVSMSYDDFVTLLNNNQKIIVFISDQNSTLQEYEEYYNSNTTTNGLD